jgi:futalosine hydrolase
MHVLLVAATTRELDAIPAEAPGPVTRLVTGVGMVATAVHLSRVLAQTSPDLVLNVGLCGVFSRRWPLGTVVHVTSDRCSELGVEDGAAFVPAEACGLLDPDAPPYTRGVLINAQPPASPALASLPVARGITVNTVHGDPATIGAVVERLAPDVESMEGAAVMYACLTAGVPFAQVRAISNDVERRNRAAWRIDDALAALAPVTAAILADVQSPR